MKEGAGETRGRGDKEMRSATARIEVIDLVGSKGFTSRDKAAVLMTMRAKLDALGFTVEPRVIERERLGHSTREPALEVSWL